MGTIAARKCREIVRNTEFVIAVELLCASQAMDLFTDMKAGQGTLAAYHVIRNSIPHMEKDRVLSYDITSMVNLIKNGEIIEAVEKAVGKLN